MNDLDPADMIITRVSSPALDAILGHPFPVLDCGFVRAVDYMGGDASIVQAARVSYGKGTKKRREDRGLIRYLLRHSHTTPFEMAQLKLHVKVPMDTWRQWIRHRTMGVNEYSTRYSIAIDEQQVTGQAEWRLQSTENRQGSSGYLPEHAHGDDMFSGAFLSARELQFHKDAKQVYQERLAAGVAREQARKDLPLSTYTEAYITVNLHNLLHFLTLRTDPHAQLEIRAYANVIFDQIVKVWVPTAAEAFEDYRKGSFTVSAIESRIMRGEVRAADVLSKGELAEFRDKLQEMGCPGHIREYVCSPEPSPKDEPDEADGSDHASDDTPDT